jgi:hypothetical protein
MIWLRRIGIVLGCVTMLAIVAWLFRASIAETLIGAYFKEQGIVSDVTVSRLQWSGLAGRVALGDANAPDLSADDVEVVFDQNGWLPRIVALRITHPVVRVRVDANGTVTLPALQSWIDKITSGPAGHSRFVSDDLLVDLQNLRAIVTTPGGTVDLGGNAQMRHNALTFLDLTAQPTALSHNGQVLRIDGARVSARTLATGLSLNAQFAGALNRDQPQQSLRATGINATLAASGIKWGAGGDISAAAAQLQMTAQDLRAGAAHLLTPNAHVSLANIRTSTSNGHWAARADMQAQASAQTVPADMLVLFKQLPVVGTDRNLSNAVASAARSLTLTLAAHVSGGDGTFGLQLATPATLDGSNGAMLRLNTLTLEDSADALRGAADARLDGGGLPSLSLTSHNFTWARAANDVTADAALTARFDFDMLQDADISATGNASIHAGRFAFTLGQCAQTRIGAVRARRKTMLRRINGVVCASGNAPLIASDANGWTVTGLAKTLATDIPSAPAKLSHANGKFLLEGRNGKLSGLFQLAQARIADTGKAMRFHPLDGRATATLNGNRIVGEAIVTRARSRIGRVTFMHDIASGTGKADIAARDLNFDPKGLQPENLSPLLAQIRNAKGRASFTGTVAWTRRAMTSQGVLEIAQLDFASPLGPAHALQSSIAFRSLLPPITADGQKLDIAKIDWTLPFTDTHAVFALTPDALRVDGAKTNVAGGAASLDGMTVELGGKGALHDTARLENIDLAQIVSATNIGSKVKVVGRVNGVVPFTSSAEGFRIAKGHVESVGPGRLSIDRSLWTKGDVAVNGVQDFAYQALENLAVDSMTADIDSVDNGRLRIIFHVKGRSDPPKPQEAKVGLFDLIRGTAFDKPIALPSGTPIDLTLETSLNFDELLKSYQAAWSDSLTGTPTPKRGTKK